MPNVTHRGRIQGFLFARTAVCCGCVAVSDIYYLWRQNGGGVNHLVPNKRQTTI